MAALHAFSTLNFWWLVAGLGAGYALRGWANFFEKNRPATFSRPLYSFMGDWVMWKDMLTGRSGSERRAGPFAFWSSAAPWLALAALGLAVALLHARPQERPTFLNTLWLFLTGIAGQAAAQLIWALGFPDAAATVHAIFRFVSAIALIRLAGFAAFRLLLPLIGCTRRASSRTSPSWRVYVIYGLAQLRGAGLDLSSIVTTSAILTAVIAFAMQDTLGNVLAGVAVQLDNSVRIGDWIRVDKVSGRVRDIRWRSTLSSRRATGRLLSCRTACS